MFEFRMWLAGLLDELSWRIQPSWDICEDCQHCLDTEEKE